MTISYRLKLTILITAVSVILTSAGLFSLYHFTYKNMFESVSENLRDALKLLAQLIDEEDKKAIKRLKEAIRKEAEPTAEDVQRVYSGEIINKLSQDRIDEIQSSEDFKRIVHKLDLIFYASLHSGITFEDILIPENKLKALDYGAFFPYFATEFDWTGKYNIALTLASGLYMPIEDVWPGNPIGTLMRVEKPAFGYPENTPYVHDELYLDPYYTVLFGFINIYYEGEPLAVLSIEYPTGKELNKIMWMKKYSFLLVFASLIVGLLVSYYISKRMTKNLSQLQDAAVQIKEHNYEVNVDIDNKDEFGIISQSFNQMAREIDRSMTELEGNNERLRSVIRDMHDDVGAVLASINIASNDDEATKSLAKRGMAEVRFLMDAMEYDNCDLGVLRKGIEMLAVDTLKPQGVVWTLEKSGENHEISFQMYLDIQRVAREAFTNIIKHSDASMCIIELKSDDRYISMEISDNGKPLEKSLAESGGQGLNNIKFRVERYLGELSVKQDDSGFAVKTSFRVNDDNIL